MKKNRIIEKKNSSLFHKSKKIVKLITLFLAFGLMPLAASEYNQVTNLSIEMRNVKVSEVLNAIEKKSEFRFAYNPDYVDLDRKVTVDLDKKTINEVLKVIFEGTDVVYEIFGRHILLFPKNVSLTNESSAPRVTSSQQGRVTGTVTDISGQPLPGATVVVQGTNQGTVTDADGNYTVSNITDNTTLVFSFIGMQTQEVIVGNRTSINLVMQEDAIGLDEVVAVGYGVSHGR